MWQAIKETDKIPKLKNPVLLEGLPGIGNVGKIAIDFVIQELRAKKLYSLFSYTFPHTVFVNDDDLVELPSIEVYYKTFDGKNGKKDLLILTGDVQPVDEVSSYEFCEKVISIAKEMGVDEVITTGGIGLPRAPEKPRVYITGNNKETIQKYSKNADVETKIHGVVGPIVGVSGLLVGLGKLRQLNGVALLAETYGHPMYLGVSGAAEIIRVLNAKLGINLNVDKLNKEIQQLETETMKRTKKLSAIQAFKKGKNETSYIG
ncbi:MAG TPA: PAC2 family protein [Candidatus Nanoarchaeia archaeon]|nr:PAC2 family protein [Candidatus Nanoarchaeia archaeon]